MNVELTEKRYYSIGEVAQAFGVNQSLIRYWETEFSILNPKKNSKGNRKYTVQDIENLKYIYFLVKEKGYTIEGAKTYIKEHKKKSLNKLTIINRLREIKARLVKIKEQL
tara:strand:- start:1253 stop:1582 length:330 start_codon:yes stop_codon:yes gene_type:complete